MFLFNEFNVNPVGDDWELSIRVIFDEVGKSVGTLSISIPELKLAAEEKIVLDSSKKDVTFTYSFKVDIL
jgi:hypothetical protein